MNNMLYINLDFQNYKNKTLAQIKYFCKKNMKTFLIAKEIDSNNRYFMKLYSYDISKGLEELEVQELLNKKHKTKFFKEIAEFIQNVTDEYNFDLIYIRRMDIYIIFFRKLFKNMYNNSRIIYEFPTFPFDKIKNFKVTIFQKIEIFYFNVFLKRYIDYITIMKQNNIKYDKKIIEIYNGVDIDRYDISNRSVPTNNNEINFVAIAHVNRWHGYDKFIQSLKNYKGKIKVTFTIISNETAEIARLKKIVQDNEMSKVVFFRNYDKLDIIKESNYYNIAIGGLAYNERGAIYDTSIKNKEYCALGLPFVNRCRDLLFPEDFKYMYTLGADEIIIEDIIKWYEKLDKNKIITEMNSYARENLTFDKSMDKIMKKLKK